MADFAPERGTRGGGGNTLNQLGWERWLGEVGKVDFITLGVQLW